MNLTVAERREALAEVAADNRSGLFSEDSAAWFRSACLEEHEPGYMCLREKGHTVNNSETLPREPTHWHGSKEHDHPENPYNTGPGHNHDGYALPAVYEPPPMNNPEALTEELREAHKTLFVEGSLGEPQQAFCGIDGDLMPCSGLRAADYIDTLTTRLREVEEALARVRELARIAHLNGWGGVNPYDIDEALSTERTPT